MEGLGLAIRAANLRRSHHLTSGQILKVATLSTDRTPSSLALLYHSGGSIGELMSEDHGIAALERYGDNCRSPYAHTLPYYTNVTRVISYTL